MRLYTALVALFLFSAPFGHAADDDKFQSESLKGLKGVYVLVEELDPRAEQAGLTVANLQTDVELKLRVAGIPVLSRQESFAAPGNPYLYILVRVNSKNVDPWPYDILVELHQNVTLVRNPRIVVSNAATWSRGGVGSVTKQNIRSLRDQVKDLVDWFINAYLAMNPKR